MKNRIRPSYKTKLAVDIFEVCTKIHQRYLNAVVDLADYNDSKTLSAAHEALSKLLAKEKDPHGT